MIVATPLALQSTRIASLLYRLCLVVPRPALQGVASAFAVVVPAAAAVAVAAVASFAQLCSVWAAPPGRAGSQGTAAGAPPSGASSPRPTAQRSPSLRNTASPRRPGAPQLQFWTSEPVVTGHVIQQPHCEDGSCGTASVCCNSH